MSSDDSVDLSGDAALACSLSAAELQVRSEVNESLFAHAQGVQELPDGYRFAFLAEADTGRNLMQFILAERACCPFFTFELTFPSPHQAIYLTVRGGEGVKEIVRASVASTIIERTSADMEAHLVV